MRWVRRVAVAALLAAPVLVVVAVAWPSGGGSGDRATRGPLRPGDEVSDGLDFGEVARFELDADGRVRVDVRGDPPVDATLTVVDGDGGQVAYDDDTNGLDPEVTVDAGDADLTVEVRELGGNPGGFTITVTDAE